MTIRESADQIIDWVAQAGATGDLIVDEGSSLSLKAQEGELEEYKVNSSRIFGLRVINEGRVGTAYSEASDSAALRSMVDQALVNAQFAAAEEHEKILPNSDQLHTDDTLLCPEEHVAVEDKIEIALRLERELSAKDKVSNVPYNGLQNHHTQRHIFTSAGLVARSAQKACVCYAYALVEDEDLNAMQGTGQVTRLFSEFDVDAIVEKVYADCIDLLDGKPVPSQHYDVIFDRESQVQLFDTFALMFSGKAAKDGVNPMREKVGEIIADTRLSIADSPHQIDGFGYALFDAEGTATRTTPLVVDGRLESLLHNSATASYFDLETTGHASRDPKSTLAVDAHQLEIAAGSSDQSELLAGTYLELTDLMGLHSGANPISGDFSLGASGFLCRDGQRQQAVRGITVAGNFYQMLTQIAAIGNEQYWNWERSARMPALRFGDMAISG